MNFRILAPVCLGAILSLGIVASVPAPAAAQTRQSCHMKGLWSTQPGDVWEFDAAYVYNHGEDDFTGIYDNPGIAKANVTGSARKGTWNIGLNYVDSAHNGYVKKLVGTGTQDPLTHLIAVRGSFQMFKPGVAAAAQTGTFTLEGVCH